MTLLSLVRSATDRIGLPQPATIIGATDPTTRRLLGLANQEGRELAKRFDWQLLRKEATFTTLAQETQTSAVPAAWDRFVSRSMWNRTRRWELRGPYSPQDWQAMKATQVQPYINNFTVRGNDILIYPDPDADDTVAYEYISKNWCQSSGATPQSAWAADSDTGILPEETMSLGLIWRWKKSRGLAWEADYAEWDAACVEAEIRDGFVATVDFSASTRQRLPGVIISDGDWNLPS